MGRRRCATAGVNPAYSSTSSLARGRQASPAEPPPSHTPLGGVWWNTSGDGRSESGLLLHLEIAGRQVSPAEPPPLHTPPGGFWWNTSGDGRSESALLLHLDIAGEAGLPRGAPSVAYAAWRLLVEHVRRDGRSESALLLHLDIAGEAGLVACAARRRLMWLRRRRGARWLEAPLRAAPPSPGPTASPPRRGAPRAPPV
jgi:hypothetical protein